jgi:dehydrogenase/reductase SDR family protein 12
MPDFHAKMKDKLRSVEQGADTIVWLAIAEKPLNCENGTFFQDRQSVSTHLPLARTRSTPEECKELMVKLDEYNKRFTV